MKSAGCNPRKRWRAGRQAEGGSEGGRECNPDVNLHKYGSRGGLDVFRPCLDRQ